MHSGAALEPGDEALLRECVELKDRSRRFGYIWSMVESFRDSNASINASIEQSSGTVGSDGTSPSAHPETRRGGPGDPISEMFLLSLLMESWVARNFPGNPDIDDDEPSSESE